MDIGNNSALCNTQPTCAAQRLILANRSDVCRQGIGDCTARGIARSGKCLHIVTGFDCQLRDCPDKVLKLIVLGDEICFRIDFDSRTRGAIDSNANKAFCRSAARLL